MNSAELFLAGESIAQITEMMRIGGHDDMTHKKIILIYRRLRQRRLIRKKPYITAEDAGLLLERCKSRL